MGHRANLILVDESDFSLYFCHWCALNIPGNLFWGPTHAQAFIQNQELEQWGWLDTNWAEGGVVFDPFQKVLLFWGGEDLRFDSSLRRTYFELMQYQWPDWELRWAHQGQLDLADYLNIESSVLITPDVASTEMSVPTRPSDLALVDFVITINFEDEGLWVFPIDSGYYFLSWLARGPVILEKSKAEREFQTFDFQAQGVDFPFAGIHIDEAERLMTIWSADAFHLPAEISIKWPGWRFDLINADSAQHASLTNGAITLPEPDQELHLNQLAEILLPQSPSPLDALANMMERYKAEDKNVQVNPHAMQYNPLELSEEVKAEIFGDAVQKWRQRRHLE